MSVHVEYILGERQIVNANHPCRAVQRTKGESPTFSGKLSEITCKLCRAWIEGRPSIWNRLRLADIEAGTAQDLAQLAADHRQRFFTKLERAKKAKEKREKRAA